MTPTRSAVLEEAIRRAEKRRDAERDPDTHTVHSDHCTCP
jgi:hypothetical protein